MSIYAIGDLHLSGEPPTKPMEIFGEYWLGHKEKIKEKNEERIIVSNTVIPTEDLDLIKNEKKDSTEEENEVLRKYLIIMLEYYTG